MTNLSKIDHPIYNIYWAPPNTDILESISDINNKLSFVVQMDNVFKLESNPLYTWMSTFPQKEEILKLIYENDSVYDPQSVYVFKEHLEEFTFPIDEFKYTMRYFRYIYDEYKSEACVLLLINMNTKQWRVLPVVQINPNGGHVKYLFPNSDDYDHDIPDIDKPISIMNNEFNELYRQGYRIYGTIHSHCNFSAFHSGTDDNDEYGFNGLHITIGNVRSGWSYACRIILDGAEFTKNITDILKIDDVAQLDINDEIDGIEIKPDHISLIVMYQKPNIVGFGKAKKIPCSNWNNWKYKSFDHDRYYQNNSNGNYAYNGFDTSLINLSDYHDAVCDADEIVCLYDPKRRDIVIVKTNFYDQHEEFFEGLIRFEISVPDNILFAQEEVDKWELEINDDTLE